MIFIGVNRWDNFIQVNRVEIFKTNVESIHIASIVIDKLSQLFPDSKINFDLDDCDKILRLEGNDFTVRAVEETVTAMKYSCIHLKD